MKSNELDRNPKLEYSNIVQSIILVLEFNSVDRYSIWIGFERKEFNFLTVFWFLKNKYYKNPTRGLTNKTNKLKWNYKIIKILKQINS